jgi:hypothetical protein
MANLLHAPMFDLPSDICGLVNVLKPLNTYFSSPTCFLLPPEFIGSPQTLFSEILQLLLSLNLRDQVYIRTTKKRQYFCYVGV